MSDILKIVNPPPPKRPLRRCLLRRSDQTELAQEIMDIAGAVADDKSSDEWSAL